MNVVEPSVSTASRSRTRTCRLAICSAPQASDNVTVGRSASGTSATVTPMANTNPSDDGVARQDRQREEQRPHADGDRRHGPHHPMQLQGQRARRRWRHRGQPGDARQPSRRTGGRDDGFPLALHDERPGVQLGVHGDRSRLTLAGQQGCVHEQLVGEGDRGVSRDAITWLEHEGVADHDVDGFDLHATAVAADGDAAWEQRRRVARRRGRHGSPATNANTALRMTTRKIATPSCGRPAMSASAAGDPQHDREEVHEVAQEADHRRRAPRRRQLVRDRRVRVATAPRSSRARPR